MAICNIYWKFNFDWCENEINPNESNMEDEVLN